MAHKILVPVELDLIREGAYKHQIDEALREVCQAVAAHRDKYGPDGKGAKGKVVAEIQILGTEEDETVFGCVAKVKRELPGAPAMTSMLIGQEDQTGQPDLFCRRSGSDKDTPQQGKMFTTDGRSIDPGTGEVLES